MDSTRTADEHGTAVLPHGIDLAYESFGDPRDPAVLLVMGLGASMLFWSADFCGELADRGFRVVRFDNRDCGRSTWLDDPAHTIGRGRLVKTFLGLERQVPYGISDFAADAVGLLDHLGVERAHVVGMSMGGMIAQTIAIEHPERTLSLTSISSTTGHRSVGQQHPKLLPTLLAGTGTTREDYLDHMVAMGPKTGSPEFPTPAAENRAFAAACWEHGINRAGTLRHMVAVLTQPDRTAALGAVRVPSLVIHGAADVMVLPSGGRATADALPAAQYLVVPGMGHDLPRALWPVFHDAIVATTAGVGV